MPLKSNFRFLNGKAFEKALLELGPKIASNLGDRALRAGARVIVKEAKRLVPVNKGDLKRSITARLARIKARNERKVFIGFRKPVSRRAHLTEFGTSTQKAQPFMRPALDTKHGEALTAMQEELARGIVRKEWNKAVTILAEDGDLDFGGDI